MARTIEFCERLLSLHCGITRLQRKYIHGTAILAIISELIISYLFSDYGAHVADWLAMHLRQVHDFSRFVWILVLQHIQLAASEMIRLMYDYAHASYMPSKNKNLRLIYSAGCCDHMHQIKFDN